MSISKIFAFIRGKSKIKIPKTATILTRDQHCISRKNISANALKVLYRLNSAGYQAFLVGGCVRDLLLGREPKDFDIATNANPQEIKKIFRNGRVIGRRFQIVHVLFKNEIIEVSTFRAYQNNDLESYKSDEGMLLRDNVYGSIVDDAKRRDFTVNAFFYNIADFSVIDFHDGLSDLKNGVLRIIGDPQTRYREDPVRMLRVVRFAAKLGFKIDPETEMPLSELRFLLKNISPARLFTEILKLFLGGQSLETFKQLRHYRMLDFLFPATESMLQSPGFAKINDFINNLLEDTDARVNNGKTVSPGYLTAALLWHSFDKSYQASKHSIKEFMVAFNIAYGNIVSEQQQAASIPKNFFLTARTIWEMQYRMFQRKPNKCLSVVHHPRFRAGYDFLQLRFRSGEPIDEIYHWWTEFYYANSETRETLLNELVEHSKQKKQSRRADY